MANRRHNKGVQIIYYIGSYHMFAGEKIVIHGANSGSGC